MLTLTDWEMQMSTNRPMTISIFLLNGTVTAMIPAGHCQGVCPMLTKMMTVIVAAAALTAGLTPDAFAFSGGVSHVVTHPAPVIAVPMTRSTPAIRLRDVCQRTRP